MSTRPDRIATTDIPTTALRDRLASLNAGPLTPTHAAERAALVRELMDRIERSRTDAHI